MKLLNYVSRLKRRDCDERFSTLHAADNERTFCGKELGEWWFIEEPTELDPGDVTCDSCRKVMRKLGFELL